MVKITITYNNVFFFRSPNCENACYHKIYGLDVEVNLGALGMCECLVHTTLSPSTHLS